MTTESWFTAPGLWHESPDTLGFVHGGTNTGKPWETYCVGKPLVLFSAVFPGLAKNDTIVISAIRTKDGAIYLSVGIDVPHATGISTG